MSYCPLMSYAKQYQEKVRCLGKDCALAADEAGDCLIQQALQLHVARERTRLADETERLKQEAEAAVRYWEAMKNSDKRIVPIEKSPSPYPWHD